MTDRPDPTAFTVAISPYNPDLEPWPDWCRYASREWADSTVRFFEFWAKQAPRTPDTGDDG